jgi:hypothetical protein
LGVEILYPQMERGIFIDLNVHPPILPSSWYLSKMLHFLSVIKILKYGETIKVGEREDQAQQQVQVWLEGFQEWSLHQPRQKAAS